MGRAAHCSGEAEWDRAICEAHPKFDGDGFDSANVDMINGHPMCPCPIVLNGCCLERRAVRLIQQVCCPTYALMELVCTVVPAAMAAVAKTTERTNPLLWLVVERDEFNTLQQAKANPFRVPLHFVRITSKNEDIAKELASFKLKNYAKPRVVVMSCRKAVKAVNASGGGNTWVQRVAPDVAIVPCTGSDSMYNMVLDPHDGVSPWCIVRETSKMRPTKSFHKHMRKIKQPTTITISTHLPEPEPVHVVSDSSSSDGSSSDGGTPPRRPRKPPLEAAASASPLLFDDETETETETASEAETETETASESPRSSPHRPPTDPAVEEDPFCSPSPRCSKRRRIPTAD